MGIAVLAVCCQGALNAWLGSWRRAAEIERQDGNAWRRDGEHGHGWSRAGEAEVQHWNVAANLV
jgi:hypothetical protein